MSLFAVLGSRGFIGHRLADHLRAKGHEVFAPDTLDDRLYERPLGRVIYCIGVTTDYSNRPLDTADSHVGALIPLLRRASFDSLIYLSSVRLYDGLSGIAAEDTGLRLDPQFSRHLYDLSKSLGEALIYHGGRPGAVVRLASVYDDRLDRDDFLCRTVRRALAGGTIDVDAAPDGGRDYIHIDDVVKSLEAVALRGTKRLYNVATGVLFANAVLADICQHELGTTFRFRRGKEANLPPRIDAGLIAREFGLRPESPSAHLPRILRALKDGSARPASSIDK